MLNLYRFVVYGLLGWGIDTADRSFLVGHYAAGTWIPFFSIAYPIAALVALYVHKHFAHDRPLYQQFVMQAFAATMIEYLAGLIGIQFLGYKLWDYSSSALNLNGLIEFWHAIAWGVVTLLLVHIIDPFFVKLYARKA